MPARQAIEIFAMAELDLSKRSLINPEAIDPHAELIRSLGPESQLNDNGLKTCVSVEVDLVGPGSRPTFPPPTKGIRSRTSPPERISTTKKLSERSKRPKKESLGW